MAGKNIRDDKYVASPNAILEPQITLESLSGDTLVLSVSPEWKRKLADFLKYAATTDDEDVDCFVSLDALEEIKGKIFLQMNQSNGLKLSKSDLSRILSATIALSSLSHGDFYDYPPDDFDRLHDDIGTIYEKVSGKKLPGKKRIKPGISGEFYG